MQLLASFPENARSGPDLFCAHASVTRDLCQCFRFVADNLAVFQRDSQQLKVLSGGSVTDISCADG
jgi:hypothetical protein